MNKSGIAAALFLLVMPVHAADDARGAKLAAANDKLSAEYKIIMAQQTNPKDRTALRDLERGWIAYKDKECLFEDGGGDGTVQLPGMALWSNYADCELRVTEARTVELKAMECAGVSVCAPHPR